MIFGLTSSARPQPVETDPNARVQGAVGKVREQASLRKSKASAEGSVLLEESAEFALEDEAWDSADMEAEATAGFRAADAQVPAAPTEPLPSPEPNAAAT